MHNTSFQTYSHFTSSSCLSTYWHTLFRKIHSTHKWFAAKSSNCFPYLCMIRSTFFLVRNTTKSPSKAAMYRTVRVKVQNKRAPKPSCQGENSQNWKNPHAEKKALTWVRCHRGHVILCPLPLFPLTTLSFPLTYWFPRKIWSAIRKGEWRGGRTDRRGTLAIFAMFTDEGKRLLSSSPSCLPSCHAMPSPKHGCLLWRQILLPQ